MPSVGFLFLSPLGESMGSSWGFVDAYDQVIGLFRLGEPLVANVDVWTSCRALTPEEGAAGGAHLSFLNSPAASWVPS